MFDLLENWVETNGRLMTYGITLFLTVVIGLIAVMPCPLNAEALVLSSGDSAPSDVIISGRVDLASFTREIALFRIELVTIDDDGNERLLFSEEQSISMSNNTFQCSVALADDIRSVFESDQRGLFRMTMVDTPDNMIELPLASIPYVVKANRAITAGQIFGDIVTIDYDHKRVGVVSGNPVVTLGVGGDISVSGTYIGDGSQLLNLPKKGHDTYDSLSNPDGSLTVVQVSSNGQIMIGNSARPVVNGIDIQVHGSLLVSNDGDSDWVQGAGSRWIWNGSNGAIRIGYAESNSWDASLVGDHSIAFGFSSLVSGQSSMVLGGFSNQVMGHHSVVFGGDSNNIYKDASVVLGGQDNRSVESNSIILGGKNNRVDAFGLVVGGQSNGGVGNRSVISGQHQRVDGDDSMALGGERSVVTGNRSIAIGSKISIPVNDAIVFSSVPVEAKVSNHVLIMAEQGMGINMAPVPGVDVSVSGNARASQWIGDGSYLRNIMADESIWVANGSDGIYLDQSMGIGMDPLDESLYVTGGIHLRGDAVAIPGTIRFDSDTFSVFNGTDWIQLNIIFQPPNYIAGTAIHLEPNTGVFSLATQNAHIGQTLIWSGTEWVPGYLDQFFEYPTDAAAYAGDLSVHQPLGLPSGNMAIGTSNVIDASLYIEGTDAMGVLAINDANTMRMGAMVDPVGVFMQHQSDTVDMSIDSYTNQMLIQFDQPGSDPITMASLSDSSVVIGSTLRSQVYAPFEVTGSLPFAAKTMMVKTMGTDIFLHNRATNSDVFKQTGAGDVTVYSEPNQSIVLTQGGEQTVKVTQSDSGHVMLGVTPTYVRSSVDVYRGSIHLDDGYGIRWMPTGSDHASVIFNSTVTDRIQLSVSDESLLAISSTGNVGLNSASRSDVDFYATSTQSHPYLLQVKPTMMGNFMSLVTSQNTYSWTRNSSDTLALTANGDPIFMMDENGHVGLRSQPDDHVQLMVGKPLSIAGDMAISSSSDTTGTMIGASTGDLLLSSSGKWIVSGEDGPVLDIDASSVALNGTHADAIDGVSVGFTVNGTMTVTSPIIASNNDQIYPLTVYDQSDDSIVIQPAHVIELDSNSGLSFQSDGTYGASIQSRPFYNKVYLPDGSVIPATGQSPLVWRGIGIDIVASENIDALIFTDSLLSGGVISGDVSLNGRIDVMGKIFGDARYIQGIPFRWAIQDRSSLHTQARDPYYDGTVIFTTRNVGIGLDAPTAALDVSGTIIAGQAEVSNNLFVSRVYATQNLQVTVSSNAIVSANRIVFGRNDYPNGGDFLEDMRLQHNQLLIGTNHSMDTLTVHRSGDVFNTLRLDSTVQAMDLATNSGAFFGMGSSADGMVVSSNRDIQFRVNQQPSLMIDADTGSVGILTTMVDASAAVFVSGNVGIGTSGTVSSTMGLGISGPVSVGLSTQGGESQVWVSGNVQVGVDADFSLLADTVAVLEGTVGVGMVDASIPLAVSGHAFLDAGIMPRSWQVTGNSPLSFRVNDDSGSQLDMIEGSGSFSIDAVDMLRFIRQDASPSLMLDQRTGDVGLGVTPNATLHIKDAAATIGIYGDDAARLVVESENGSVNMGADSDGFSLRVGNGGPPELFVGEGHVGMNTVDPHSTLDVVGTVNASVYVVDDRYATEKVSQDEATYVWEGYALFETVPSGIIIIWNQSTIPPGWAQCNGQAVTVAGQTIHTPDLREKMVKGAITNTGIGRTGGKPTVDVTIVGHSHTQATHGHSVSGYAHGPDDHGNSTVGSTTMNTQSSDAYTPINTDGYNVGEGKYTFSAGNKSKNQELEKHFDALSTPGTHNHSFNHGHTVSITDTNTDTNSHNHLLEDNAHTHDGDSHGHENVGYEPPATYMVYIMKVDEP